MKFNDTHFLKDNDKINFFRENQTILRYYIGFVDESKNPISFVFRWHIRLKFSGKASVGWIFENREGTKEVIFCKKTFNLLFILCTSIFL